MLTELSLIEKLAVAAIPVLFAITVHEVAHGWVAKRLGDPTAYMMGRLTLNPIKHIDLVGTIIVPGILLLLGGFFFGWAKPVPITWRNLHHPRRDCALVAAAGPAANLLMAIFWSLFSYVGYYIWGMQPGIGLGLILMAQTGILINVVLMVLNLIPLPPLDGSRILASFLPPAGLRILDQLENYGLWIVLALMVTGILGAIIQPVAGLLIQWLQPGFLH